MTEPQIPADVQERLERVWAQFDCRHSDREGVTCAVCARRMWDEAYRLGLSQREAQLRAKVTEAFYAGRSHAIRIEQDCGDFPIPTAEEAIDALLTPQEPGV